MDLPQNSMLPEKPKRQTQEKVHDQSMELPLNTQTDLSPLTDRVTELKQKKKQSICMTVLSVIMGVMILGLLVVVWMGEASHRREVVRVEEEIMIKAQE